MPASYELFLAGLLVLGGALVLHVVSVILFLTNAAPAALWWALGERATVFGAVLMAAGVGLTIIRRDR